MTATFPITAVPATMETVGVEITETCPIMFVPAVRAAATLTLRLAPDTFVTARVVPLTVPMFAVPALRLNVLPITTTGLVAVQTTNPGFPLVKVVPATLNNGVVIKPWIVIVDPVTSPILAVPAFRLTVLPMTLTGLVAVQTMKPGFPDVKVVPATLNKGVVMKPCTVTVEPVTSPILAVLPCRVTVLFIAWNVGVETTVT